MDFSLLEIISHLSPVEILFITIAGAFAFYFFLAKQYHVIIFILALSASLVGTTIPIIANIAALCRWLSILMLLMTGFLQSRIKVSLGVLLFWGYIVLGVIFLFRAVQLTWQLQRGILLLLVAAAIPLAYSVETYKSLRLSLISISIVAAIYSLLNFVSLPSQLDEAIRYSGFSKGAPTFVIILGSLLPFTLWGLWRIDRKVIQIACGLGLLLGIITLIFSGQRTGTVAGIISLIPLILAFPKRKTIGWSVLVLIVLLLLAYVLLQQTSAERLNFLLRRYSLEAGLSLRNIIWSTALSEIAKTPFLGRGIGAAETVISSSFHNAYLEVWYNTGIVGLFLFLASQLYFFYRIFYLRGITKDPEIKSFLALALGYMMGFTVISIFESIGAGASNLSLILYLFLGVMVSNNQLADYPQRSRERKPLLQYSPI